MNFYSVLKKLFRQDKRRTQRTPDEKTKFIEDHVYYELRWLLSAAQYSKELEARGKDFRLAIAHDSAYVHARNLFNFFCSNSKYDAHVFDFGPNKYKSDIAKVWLGSLHRHVAHISWDRLNPSNRKNNDHLADQVELLKNECLKLWKQFENDAPEEISKALLAARNLAEKDLENDANSNFTSS